MSTSLEKTMDEVVQDVRSLYDSGAPLFTKEELRRLSDHIDKHAKGELESNEVLIKGINGATVKVPIRRAITLPNGNGGYRKPKNVVIQYRPIEALTDDATPSSSWSPQTAYLSMVPGYDYVDIGGTSSATNTTRTFCAAGLGKLLGDAKKAWEATPHHHALRTYVEAYAAFAEVRKIVGLALGPLVDATELSDDGDGPRRGPSLTQYALLLSLRELIADNSGVDGISCYAQDPALSPAATKALEDAGIRVLKDPHGFLEIDDQTIVVSISPDVPVKQIVTDIARPVALVWLPDTDKEHVKKGSRSTDPSSKRVKDMLETEYVDLGFPHSDPLWGADVHLRRRKREGLELWG
ncbi:hypothetical protein F5Y14DRAFT_447182 [Nemania sp. NC0429]|nr:hypothetical protein F5Y14DRAFT_447182 [Nemania sp. NC0429]